MDSSKTPTTTKSVSSPSQHPTVTVTQTPPLADAESTFSNNNNNQSSHHHHYLSNSNSNTRPTSSSSSLSGDATKHPRPGEAIMQSDDPETAALRAWANDKQLQIPGSDGSFVLGQISMGAGAVSSGPVFLPRKEDVVEPPFHSMDHGPVRTVKDEEGEGVKEEKKKRRSISDLFRRGSVGKGEGK